VFDWRPNLSVLETLRDRFQRRGFFSNTYSKFCCTSVDVYIMLCLLSTIAEQYDLLIFFCLCAIKITFSIEKKLPKYLYVYLNLQ
jgi:hypothetical protein